MPKAAPKLSNLLKQANDWKNKSYLPSFRQIFRYWLRHDRKHNNSADSVNRHNVDFLHSNTSAIRPAVYLIYCCSMTQSQDRV